MHIRSLKLIYFSPTRTTKRIVEGIAEGIQAQEAAHLDLTPSDATTRNLEELHHEMAVIGSPVYGGRIPLDAVARLKRFRANNTPAVILVVYGNRLFEDALLELRDIVLEVGFLPVAGGAFIGEHSFATDARPIATGRPDPEDLRKAKEFGRMVRAKMEGIQAIKDIAPLQVPGNSPYRERRRLSDDSPHTQDDLCTKCGVCVSVCPKGAISLNDRVITGPTVCILCCACVKGCATGARIMEDEGIKRLAERLFTNCQARKEPEIFLA